MLQRYNFSTINKSDMFVIEKMYIFVSSKNDYLQLKF